MYPFEKQTINVKSFVLTIAVLLHTLLLFTLLLFLNGIEMNIIQYYDKMYVYICTLSWSSRLIFLTGYIYILPSHRRGVMCGGGGGGFGCVKQTRTQITINIVSEKTYINKIVLVHRYSTPTREKPLK